MAFKWLKQLTAGLTKTRSKLADGVRNLFRIGRKVDAQFLQELEETLILGDVGVAATSRIVEDLKARYRDREISPADDLLGILKKDLKESLRGSDKPLQFNPDGPTVVMVVGVNGSGKTTAVARLARLLMGEGKSVLLAACDTFRAAADEQLAIWAERVGVGIVRHRVGADPAAVAFDAAQAAIARKVDVLLVNTAGRLHTQDHLMRELGKIRKVLANKVPGARTRCCWCWMRRPARTPSLRPASSAPPPTLRASSSPNSTAPPRAGSSWRSGRNWASPSSSSAWARRPTTSPPSTRMRLLMLYLGMAPPSCHSERSEESRCIASKDCPPYTETPVPARAALHA